MDPMIVRPNTSNRTKLAKTRPSHELQPQQPESQYTCTGKAFTIACSVDFQNFPLPESFLSCFSAPVSGTVKVTIVPSFGLNIPMEDPEDSKALSHPSSIALELTSFMVLSEYYFGKTPLIDRRIVSPKLPGWKLVVSKDNCASTITVRGKAPNFVTGSYFVKNASFRI